MNSIRGLVDDDDDDDEDDVEKVSWSGEPVGSMDGFLEKGDAIALTRHRPVPSQPGVYMRLSCLIFCCFAAGLAVGISWSIKETASSVHVGGQDHGFPKIDSTPSLPRQGSGYSLSSLFKGTKLSLCCRA